MTPEENCAAQARREGVRSALAARWAGVGALGVMLLAAPLAFGSVEAWAVAVVWFLGAVCAAIALAVWVAEGRAAIVFAPVLALAFLLAAAALFQLLPLPSPLFVLFGAKTAAVHELVSGGRPERISLAPASTIAAFFRVTLVLTACFATLVLVRTRAMAFTLMAASVAAVVAASAVGILQEKDGSEKIYGFRDLAAGAEKRFWRSAALDPALSSGVARVEAADGGDGPAFFRRTVNVGDVFGPYANSNHFGGLVEIVMPVALAFLIALLGSRRGGWGEEGGFTGTAEGALVLICAFAVALGIGATVYAGSLGALGALAAGIAAVLAVMALARQAGRVTSIALVITAVAAVGAAFWLQPDLQTRLLAKVAERAEVWRTTWRAAGDFPVAGSGLGSYAFVIPRYENTEIKYLFAHNDYLQFALEGGLVLAAAAAVLLLWQAAVLVRGAFRREGPYVSALCAGAVGALAAVSFHSFFDFNMHVPANALTLAVVLSAGTVAARGRREDIETIEFEERVIVRGRWKAAAAALALLAVMAAGATSLADLTRADVAKGRAREFLARVDNSAQGAAPAGTGAVLEEVRRAMNLAPHDPELAYQASRLLWLESQSGAAGGQALDLRGESLKYAARAARLAPSYTFHAMTAVTMGAKGLNLLERWPMSAFAYHRELAEMLFDQGRNGDGFGEIRKALDLMVPDSAFAPERAMDAVAELIERFGTYERIRSAAPDSFGGRVLFGRGLALAGLSSAAVEEYIRAVDVVEEGRGLAGSTERAVIAHAERLVSAGRAEEAGRLYSAALAQRGEWQAARLSYARFLAGRGDIERAQAQIDRILAADVPMWLRTGALDVRGSISKN